MDTEPNSIQSVIIFPIDCNFTRTGIYSLSFLVQTTRIHEMPNGELRYSDFVFAKDLISKERREQVEKSSTSFVVVVQDTSVPYPVAVQQIAVNTARGKIISATGFEESNEVFFNLAGIEPSVKIVYGSGRIEQLQTLSGEKKYFWKGIVRPTIDSIVIEARVNRKAGGKDIARTSFIVLPSEPFLSRPIPYEAYAGEEFDLSIQVEGLDNSSAYSWVVAVGGEKRTSGNGFTAHYLVPKTAEGSELMVIAVYDGKTYRCVNKATRKVSESTFAFRIVKPPARIFFNPPPEVPPQNVFSFDAVRYGKRKFEKPIMPQDVEVRVVNARGENISVDLIMSQEGNYNFRLREPARTIRSAQDVTITIRAAEESVQEVVRVIKNK